MESEDEPKVTSVLQKKTLVTWLLGSEVYAVSSDKFETAISVSNYFETISVGFTILESVPKGKVPASISGDFFFNFILFEFIPS